MSVTLVFDDKYKYSVNKCKLVSLSKYFEFMFIENQSEETEITINIGDIFKIDNYDLIITIFNKIDNLISNGIIYDFLMENIPIEDYGKYIELSLYFRFDKLFDCLIHNVSCLMPYKYGAVINNNPITKNIIISPLIDTSQQVAKLFHLYDKQKKISIKKILDYKKIDIILCDLIITYFKDVEKNDNVIKFIKEKGIMYGIINNYGLYSLLFLDNSRHGSYYNLYNFYDELFYTPYKGKIMKITDIDKKKKYIEGENVIIPKSDFEQYYIKGTYGLCKYIPFECGNIIHSGGNLYDIVTGVISDKLVDIDLFLFGTDYGKINTIRTLLRNLEKDYKIYIHLNLSVITIYMESVPRMIQIVCSDKLSGKDIINLFDMSHLKMYYDGKILYASVDCMKAIRHQCTKIYTIPSIVRPFKALMKGLDIERIYTFECNQSVILNKCSIKDFVGIHSVIDYLKPKTFDYKNNSIRNDDVIYKVLLNGNFDEYHVTFNNNTLKYNRHKNCICDRSKINVCLCNVELYNKGMELDNSIEHYVSCDKGYKRYNLYIMFEGVVPVVCNDKYIIVGISIKHVQFFNLMFEFYGKISEKFKENMEKMNYVDGTLYENSEKYKFMKLIVNEQPKKYLNKIKNQPKINIMADLLINTTKCKCKYIVKYLHLQNIYERELLSQSN